MGLSNYLCLSVALSVCLSLSLSLSLYLSISVRQLYSQLRARQYVQLHNELNSPKLYDQ